MNCNIYWLTPAGERERERDFYDLHMNTKSMVKILICAVKILFNIKISALLSLGKSIHVHKTNGHLYGLEF